jgi:hypothetical protein
MSEEMKHIPIAATLSMIFLATGLHAQEPYDPVFAGTLLAVYGQNIPPGKLSVEPFLYVTRVRGLYSENWDSPTAKNGFNSQELLLSLETGITSYLDVNLNIFGFHSRSNKRDSWEYGDTQLIFGGQLLINQKGTWIPDLRILVGEVFPTGKYQDLNPNKFGADITGMGAYQTMLILAARKICYAFPTHPFNISLNVYYILSTKTKVHGFSFYRGGADTKGVVNPGNQTIVNLSGEFSFTKNWILGLDIHYLHQDHSPFRGKSGGANVGLPSYEQFSLAPCIEYVFNESLSIDIGAWFTVAGRNSVSFASGIANLFYYY